MVRALASVNLAAIERNAGLLKQRAGSAALCAVVKADGYGHGAAELGAAFVAALKEVVPTTRPAPKASKRDGKAESRPAHPAPARDESPYREG